MIPETIIREFVIVLMGIAPVARPQNDCTMLHHWFIVFLAGGDCSRLTFNCHLLLLLTLLPIRLATKLLKCIRLLSYKGGDLELPQPSLVIRALAATSTSELLGFWSSGN